MHGARGAHGAARKESMSFEAGVVVAFVQAVEVAASVVVAAATATSEVEWRSFQRQGWRQAEEDLATGWPGRL